MHRRFSDGVRLGGSYPLLLLAVLLIVIKAVQVGLDATPLFFMGDSETYIASALDGHVPVARSFTYGRLIRWLAVGPGSLYPLILAQVLAGAATAWLLGWVLLRHFHVRPAIALAVGLAFALDPLQILHERLVMAETFALLVFAVNLGLALDYVRRPRLLTLGGVCVTGLALISLRFMFVPTALAMAVMLPLLGWFFSPRDDSRRHPWTIWVGHLLFGVLVSGLLHQGYRQYVGTRSKLPPSYYYMDGLMLVSAWAPLLQPEDAAKPWLAEVVARQAEDPALPLRHHYIRESQLWNREGLVGKLLDHFDGNRYAANEAARQLCRTTLLRHPVEVARLAWRNFADYFQAPAQQQYYLLGEQGSRPPLKPPFVERLKKVFGLDAENSPAVMTPSKRYHLVGGPWYVVLLCSPLLWLVLALIAPETMRAGAWMIFAVTALLLGVVCATSAGIIYRYAHPLSFTALMAIGVLFSRRDAGNAAG